MNPTIAIIGAGYVGMQIAVTFAKAGIEVIAYDNDKQRIADLDHGIDKYLESIQYKNYKIKFSDDISSLALATHFIVALPTPINIHMVPDLAALKHATKDLGRVIKKNDVIVFESTVYPGATEELLIPILEQESGLKSGSEFYVGFSPERVVPGDAKHGLEKDVKVISGQNELALQKIKQLYEQTRSIKLYCAPSMKVAESCKLLENIQRDVNIALMNEYASIMGQMGIAMHDVLNAANTKWNFLSFKPGLVGGHCIPLDPYYLIYQANKYGARTNLISTAREVNEQFIHYIADSLLKLLKQQDSVIPSCKVILAGISFKPNVADTRHSLSLKLYTLLEQYGIEVFALDPIANRHDLNLNWVELGDMPVVDAIIITQGHEVFIDAGLNTFTAKLNLHGVLMDLPSIFNNRHSGQGNIIHWSL